VTANPEFGRFECSKDDVLILVCDGVSEGNFSNAEVCQLVAECLKTDNDPGAASRAVCHKAVEMNSKDNISCMIVLFDGVKDSHEVEFIPGPLASTKKGFLTAYTAMAEKAGMSLGQALEKRYTLVDELATLAGRPEILEELARIGKPDGAPGSAERTAWIARWDNDPKDAEAGEGGEGGGDGDLMQMLRDRPELLNLLAGQAQGRMGAEKIDGREVRAPPLAKLEASVKASDLMWDERMAMLAGEVGVVLKDDTDGTTRVRFAAKGMEAWLPTDALEDLSKGRAPLSEL